MLKDKITYMKEVLDALKTYKEENNNINNNLLNRIYGYAQNIENLSETEYHELNQFITSNQVNIEHLANIFLDEKGKEVLTKRLNWMLPCKISNPNGQIKLIEGKAEALESAVNNKIAIKVLRKTYPQTA